MNSDHNSLTNRAINGLQWSFLSVVVISVIQIGYSALMARLVAPEAFGLVAMANVILRFGTYFSRMGIGSAIIQKKDLSDDDIRAAFTAALVFGLFVTLLIVIGAPLGKLIFDDEQVVSVVRVMAFTLFIAGVSTTATSLLRRQFRFRAIALVEISSFVLGAGGVGVVLALTGYGVWSLVYSSLAQGIFLAIFSYIFCQHSLKITFNLSKYKAILSFGSKVSVVSFLEFLGYNLDSMVIGRFSGAETLGYYNRANYIVRYPAEKISGSITNILFPALSRIQHDNEKLWEAYTSTIAILGVFLFVFAFAVSASAREVIGVIYGEKWLKAIPFLQVFAISVPFGLLKRVNGILLEALGKLKQKITVTVLYLFTLITLFFVFYRVDNIGFVYAFLLTEIIFYIVYTIYIVQFLNFPKMKILKMNVNLIFCGLVTFLVVVIFKLMFGSNILTSFWTLLTEIIISINLLILFFFVVPSRALRRAISNVLVSSTFDRPGLTRVINFMRKWYLVERDELL